MKYPRPRLSDSRNQRDCASLRLAEMEKIQGKIISIARDAKGARAIEIILPWEFEDLPVGFRVISTNEEVLPGSEATVAHVLFSDGLANVSVFIAVHEGKSFAATSNVGASNSFSTLIDGFRVTAVGEVPPATVERFAKSTRLR